MTYDITHQKRWGILGDGQLARMLALSAYSLGIRPVILTGDTSSPAGQVSPLIVRGHFDNRDDLHALLSQVDGAIIESEFIDCQALEATGLAEKIFPSLSCIKTLQDKLEQKRLAARLGIPTSTLYEKTTSDDLEWISAISEQGNKPMVIKFARLGYDGKGVLILNGHGSADLQRAEEFLLGARKRKIPVYAEARVDYERELAMIAARGRDGEFKSWPLVISEQRQGTCDRVLGPAINLGVGKNLETKAQEICETISGHLGLVGTFAVEFFETAKGQLLMNEIAPRVHNSGHYTLDAGCTSQFENHWRAVLGQPLGSTTTTDFFMMQNILGVSDITSKECALPPVAGGLSHVHWYGKRGVSPGRKLGHINASCRDINERGDAMSAVHSVYGKWQEDQRQSFAKNETSGRGNSP